MSEEGDNALRMILAACFAAVGEDVVQYALEEADVDPLATAASVDPARIAEIITPVLIERLEGTLARALPNLAVQADWPLPLSALSTRARNIARDNGLLTAGALGALSVASLWSLRKAGRKSVKEFVALAVQLQLQFGETPAADAGTSHQACDADTHLGEQSSARFPSEVILTQPTSVLHLSVRSRGCLNRLGIETIGALIQYTESELLATPNFGHTSLSEVRDRLADLGLMFRRPNCVHAAGYPDHCDGDSGSQEAVSSDGMTESLGALCAILGEWAAQVPQAQDFGGILALDGRMKNLPEDVQIAASQLLRTSLEHFRAPDSLVQSLVDELFVGLDDRALAIFEARHLCTDRSTLLDISRQYGLSRERVRQIARETAAAIRSKLATRRFRSLRWRFHDVGSTMGNGAPETSDLVSQVLDRACRGLTVSAHVRALVLWASGPYRQREGWFLRKGVQRPTIPLDTDAFEGEVEITHEAVCVWLEQSGFSSELASTVLEQSGTVKQVGAKWVRWPNTVTGKAEVILRLLGRPADSVEILAMIAEEYSEQSLRNRLCDDDKFIRVNRRQFALAEWGLEEYSGITQEIIERIERDGDVTALEPLVSELVSQFDVSELSVRAYASAPMFIIEDGAIRLRRDTDIYVIDTRVETVRGLFPDPDNDVVHMVLSVDGDLKRASGMLLKEPVAGALGMKPGDQMEFGTDVDDEQVLVSWPQSSVAGPYLGGTRVLLRAMEEQAGDECVLTLDCRHRVVSLRQIPNGNVDASGLTGLAIEPGHELDALAGSLGCKRSAVRSILAARGDQRLLSILPSDAGDTRQLDDALSNLASILRQA